MQAVWVLYEEHGAYSDYQMSIRGVFSSAELGKAALVKQCYIRRELAGEWVWDGDVWHMITTDEKEWNRKTLTLAPYFMDQYNDPDERKVVINIGIEQANYRGQA